MDACHTHTHTHCLKQHFLSLFHTLTHPYSKKNLRQRPSHAYTRTHVPRPFLDHCVLLVFDIGMVSVSAVSFRRNPC